MILTKGCYIGQEDIQKMISYLKGKVIERGERSVIIASNSVGWRVFLGPNALDKMQKTKDEVRTFTHLYSRENTQELYGFLEFKELQFFELLLTVSGVGPRNAQLIIDTVSLKEIIGSINEGKIELFVRIPGIGSKIAKKIIIDLEPKVKRLGLLGEVDLSALAEEDDVVEALRSLGYKQVEAKEALKKVSKDIKGLANRVEEALKILGGRG